MKKEIGSEFWDVPITDKCNSFFEEYTCVGAGRTALYLILDDILKQDNLYSALLPSYCCESMIEPFLAKGIDVSFYECEVIDEGICCSYKGAKKYDIVLLIDFFGFDTSSTLNISAKYRIRDLTHSIFSLFQKNDFDYSFCSMRKWAGLYTGGLLYKKNGTLEFELSDNISYYELRKNAMKLKRAYIENNQKDKSYLKIFSDAEIKLETNYLFSYKEDISLENIDVEYICKKRINNASILINKLNRYCIFKSLPLDVVPLFVPIIVEKRNELRQYLIQNSVYCPIHWPKSELVQDCSLYKNCLSIVCDQRYDEEDMLLISDLILNFLDK